MEKNANVTEDHSSKMVISQDLWTPAAEPLAVELTLPPLTTSVCWAWSQTLNILHA